MKNRIVSITKIRKNIHLALTEALTPFGGLSSMINEGDTILIKPNFVAPRTNETGVTTNLELIKNISQEIHQCGGKPVLFEMPAIEQELNTVYDILNIRDFAEENGIEVYTQYNEIIKVKVPGRRRKLSVPAVTQHTKIINVPKLKTHVVARLSAAMKNLFGFLPKSERRRMHIWGIHRAIFDLNKVIKPMLTIVDAMTCMEGNGPVYGDKVTLNLLIAGTNTVAVDKVCCALVGVDEKDVGYLKLALQEDGDFEADIHGEKSYFPVKKFLLPNTNTAYKLFTRLSFVIDALWMGIAGKTLTGMLYSAGIMGTRPDYNWDLCNQCEACLRVCPVQGTLDIQKHIIDYSLCVRCLNCFYVCHSDAILVKGLTKPE